MVSIFLQADAYCELSKCIATEFVIQSDMVAAKSKVFGSNEIKKTRSRKTAMGFGALNIATRTWRNANKTRALKTATGTKKNRALKKQM